MTRRRHFAIGALIALASAAHAQPAFLVVPLEADEGEFLGVTTVRLFSDAVLAEGQLLAIKDIVHAQPAALSGSLEASLGLGNCDYSVMLAWDASPTRLLARCTSNAHALTDQPGDSANVFNAATLDRPQRPGADGSLPRFSLSEPALVFFRADASDFISGPISSLDLGYRLARHDGASSVTLFEDFAPDFPEQDHDWTSSASELIMLPAGDYELYVNAEHQGGASSPPVVGGGQEMFASADVRIELRIIPGCSLADIAPPLGQADFSDVVAFLTAFAAHEPEADLASPPERWDFSDVVAFLTAFADGCP
ncbi:MAG: GC-type dockerin domain-anchored protein [Phycisphaerales bacterium]